MDAKTAQTLYQFLQRANLAGSEVPAYVHCAQVLERIIYADAQEQAKLAVEGAATPETPDQQRALPLPEMAIPPPPAAPNGALRRPAGA